MLTEREKEQLLERQARVYEVLDVATKPAQWLLGGVKLVFLLLVFAGVCIVGPLYQHFHGGAFSNFQFALGWFILGFVVMLFGAPWYTVLWGAVIFCSLFWWDISKDDASRSLFTTVVWLYEGVGLLWILVKVVHWMRARRGARADEYTAFRREHPDLYEKYTDYDKLPMLARSFAFDNIQDARRARGVRTSDDVWSMTGRRKKV